MWDGADKVCGGAGRQVFRSQPEIVYKLYEISDGLSLKPVHGGIHDNPRVFRDFIGKPKKGERPMVIVMGFKEVIEKLAGTNAALLVNSDGSFTEGDSAY